MAVFVKMNHPGVYFTALWMAIVVLGIVFLQQIIQNDTASPSTYVCPPCGCSRHMEVFDFPGNCPSCTMPLIRNDRPRVQAIEQLFRIERQISFFHYKVFYPAYFLAIFVGFFSFFKFRHRLPMVLFHVYFLSFVLYAFKHQLSGTSYSLLAPPRWQFFPVAFLLLASPALYLYIKYSLKKKKVFSKKAFLHFLPGGLVVLIYGLFFFGMKSWRDWALFNNFDHYFGMAEQFTFILSGTYYLILSGNVIKQKDTINSSFIVWLRGLLWTQGILLLAWSFMLVANLFLFSMMSTSLDYHLVWTIMAIFSLLGAYFILFKKELIYANGYKKENRIAQEVIEPLKAKLDFIMQTERPFLNPELSLQMLAQMMELKEKELSELLNIGFGSSFYAYINHYRLEEVKKMLLDTQYQHFTNFAIAQQAGFSSKSTFFNLFKKYQGMTPGAFKKKHING